MAEAKEILNQFFRTEGDGLVKSISHLDPSKQNAIMTLKATFESERQSKSGCTGCKLRRLMKKYRPQVEAALNG